MKFIINLLFLTTLLAQDLSEIVRGNKIIFSDFSEKNSGDFLAFPNIDFKILKQDGITIQKAFTRKSNIYYEIEIQNEATHLELEFEKSLSYLKRGRKDLSLNKLFFDVEAFKNKKKKISRTPSYLISDQSIKIKTDGKGVYRLTLKYFTDNLIDISSLFTNRLKLFNKGKEIPIFIESGDNEFIDEKNEYILFYAEDNLNTNFTESDDIYFDPYDKFNNYWLISSVDDKPGLRLFLKNGLNIEKDDDKIFTPLFFSANEHIEKNNLLGTKYIPRLEPEFSNKGFFHHRDFFFWGPSIKNDRFYGFDLSQVTNVHLTQNDSVEVELMMSGSAGTYTGTHKVDVKISKGSFAYENADWRYSYKNKIDLKFPYDFMNIENNTLELKAVEDNDLLLMNWINIKYNKKFITNDNILEFSAIKPTPHPIIGQQYSVYEYVLEGFRHNVLFLMKKNEAIITNFDINKNEDDTYTITFQDEIENESAEYIAISNDKYKEPFSIKYNATYQNKSLLEITSETEMLILAPEAFLDKAAEYSEFKNEKLQTTVISTEAIFNEFNYGNSSPVAIKDFLKFAYENWSPENTLKYVFLLGDAERDYFKGNDKENIIPTFQFISAKFGYVTSDTFYGYLYHSDPYIVDFNNNPISDLYVGRIPAENEAELDAYLSKMKEYDVSSTQEKNLFLAGNDFSTALGNREIYTNKRVFINQNARMNNTEGAISKFSMMKRASDDDFESTNTVLLGTDELIEIFNEGVNYISFLGHGAGAVWGDRNIMFQNDVERLQNKNKYPLVSSLTCFIGAFDGGRTLGEELILQRNAGAIGVLGSSGVSLLYNQYMFGYYLNEFVFQNKFSYGEALSLGKYKYFRKGGNYITDTDLFSTPEHSIHKTLMLMEFNYMGDPSIRIKFPDETDVITEAKTISENSNLQFDLENIPANSYSLKYQLIDYLGEVLVDKDTIVDINDNITLMINNFNLTDQDIYYVKGSLKSDTKVMNFGKRFLKDDYESIDHITVVDPSDNSDAQLFSNSDYRLKFVTTQKFTNFTATAKLYRFDQTRFDRYHLTFSSLDSINFISDEVFHVNKDISDMDLTEIRAFRGQEEIEFRNNNLKTIPTKYIISPLRNSLLVDYSEETNIDVTVSYPLSFTDTLDVFADYFRVELDSIYYLGKDTVHFVQTNSNKLSQLNILEDYRGQYAKYRIRFYTANPELELDSINQIIETEWRNIPNTYVNSSADEVYDVTLTNDLNLTIKLNPSNFANSEENSVLDVTYIDINKTLSSDYENILANKILSIDFHNDNIQLINLDTSSFKAYLSKSLWSSYNLDKISLVYFNTEIEDWLEVESTLEIGVDSTLIVKSANFNSDKKFYTIVAITKENKFQVDVNFEIDGIKSDSIQFTSLNPKIKVNLFSQSTEYILNPDNIKLRIKKDNGIESDIPFSHSYSGANKNNLNIIIDGSTNFNEDGNYRINVDVGGFTQVFRVINGERQVILNNQISQILNISGSDKLKVYGNYPNPFGRKTIIPIQLSSSSNNNLELVLKIYSMSGLLVKTIDSSNMLFANTANNGSLYGEDISGDVKIGMNYIAWDGFSKNGNELANGVYFVKVIYTTSNKTQEKIIKIAKIKGYN